MATKNNVESLEDAFVIKLRELYDMEKQLVKTLPKLAKNADDEMLSQAFEDHLAETEHQVERLETIFEALELKPQGKKGAAIAGLLEGGKETMELKGDNKTRDALLIADAQSVEHLEMALYGTAIAWAHSLGFEDIAEVLEETLEEEKAADELLNSIAVDHINDKAAEELLDDDDSEEE